MRNTLHIFVPSMGGHDDAVSTWMDTMSKPWPVTIDMRTEGESAGFLTKCEEGWRKIDDANIIGYLHSDLYILEYNWDQRVLAEFNDPDVAVVGFVGATGLGTDDIFRVPYDYRQLARNGVISNLVDWSNHGEREIGSRNVAVVDSCAVFVRRAFLERIGGWPVATYPNSSHCSDLWICCMVHRHGLLSRVSGIRCTHRSGGKGQAGSKWLNERGGDESLHRKAHEVLYEEFRDILPCRK